MGSNLTSTRTLLHQSTNNFAGISESYKTDQLQIGQIPSKGRIADLFRAMGLAKLSPLVTVPIERIVNAS